VARQRSELRDQVVLIGAHYDHVGQEGEPDPGRDQGSDPRDTIWNGADDNASGTAVVLDLAQAFARSGLRPRRSVMFVLFGAEEYGLYGSRHFTEVPPIPLSRIALMINLDMVGRNPDKPVEVLGARSRRRDLRCARSCSARAARRASRWPSRKSLPRTTAITRTSSPARCRRCSSSPAITTTTTARATR
jgi:Zn-dependent M28 family amino/carboxypeptidase